MLKKPQLRNDYDDDDDSSEERSAISEEHEDTVSIILYQLFSVAMLCISLLRLKTR